MTKIRASIASPQTIQKAQEVFLMKSRLYFQELSRAQSTYLTGYLLDKDKKVVSPIYSKEGQQIIDMCNDHILLIKTMVMDDYGITHTELEYPPDDLNPPKP